MGSCCCKSSSAACAHKGDYGSGVGGYLPTPHDDRCNTHHQQFARHFNEVFEPLTPPGTPTVTPARQSRSRRHAVYARA